MSEVGTIETDIVVTGPIPQQRQILVSCARGGGIM